MIGLLEIFDEKGYEVDFISPTEKKPVVPIHSMCHTFVVLPLINLIVKKPFGQKTHEIEESDRLSNPISCLRKIPLW